MTFKDLKKRVSIDQKVQQQTRLFDRLDNRPFLIWDTEEHLKEDVRTNGDCCFNHIIGLPKKNDIDKPIFDYEKIIFDSLQYHCHVWTKKATGPGITEFMLRFMAWLCLKDNTLSASEMCIVTGPRIDLAIGLIDRMKRLFYDKGLVFDNKETVIELNVVHIVVWIW